MASSVPASPTRTTRSSDRAPLRLALIAALALAAPLFSAPLRAQDQPANPELKDLIPDSALGDPEAWARLGNDPAVIVPMPELDPASPLAELPGMPVPWPETETTATSDGTPPELASLPVDPDTEQALAAARAAAPLGPELAAGKGEEIAVADHLTLVFPQNLATFPEREAFLDRFRALSALRKFDSGKDTIAQVAARARADKDLIERLLRIYGYYDSAVTQVVGNSDLAPPDAGGEKVEGDVAVRFEIAPGARYRFGAVDLGHLNHTGADYPALRDTVKIKPGDFLDNDRIVAGRDALDVGLGETGYAFARVGVPDFLVDHKREEGDLTIAVEPGGKYRVGPVISQNPRFLSSKHLADIARFRSGDLYQRSLREDLKRAILATGLVSSVTVTLRDLKAGTATSGGAAAPGSGTPPPTASGATAENAATRGTAPATGDVALDVELVPGPLRTVAGLVGYESGDGFRVEASWEHRNFFPPEGMLRVRGIAGTKEQLLGTTVRWNNFHGRDQVLTLDLYANTVARDAYNARTLAFTATFEKLTTLLFQKPWVWSAGLEVLASGERESSAPGQFVPRNTYFIAAIPLRGAFDFSDSLLDPTKGWRAALRLSPEISRQQGAGTVQYVRTQFDLSGYKPVGGKVVLAARARVGSIPGAPLADIAPSRRFYAGGGGSVRGYGYQAIGPRNSIGDPSGGRSLVELALEARIDTGLLGGALQVVPFLDAGTVSESITPTLAGMRYGAGLGLRYKTGFGPLRLDIGTPLSRRPGDGRVTVSVALGQAF